MSVIMPLGSLAQFRLQGLLHGQVVMCTWLYESDAEVPDAAVAMQFAAAQFEEDVWIPALQPALSIELNSIRIYGQWVSPIRLVPTQYNPATTVGAVSGSALPSGVSIVVRKLSEYSGHRYRGRVFLPGIPVTAESDSSVATAWMTANASAIQFAMINALNMNVAGSAKLWPVVGSYNPNVQPHTKQVVRVTSAVVDPIIRYQRRREVGVGV